MQRVTTLCRGPGRVAMVEESIMLKKFSAIIVCLVLFAGMSFVALKSNRVRTFFGLPFKESALAHKLLDGKKGIEIGGSAHNPFGLNTLNVDFTDDLSTEYKLAEVKSCGQCMKVDIVAPGDQLPLKDNSLDFVISSHVIEHFYDPVKTMKEWLRVVKPGGYVYVIAPHKERTFDKDRPRTTLAEIIERHDHPNPPEHDDHHHYSVWITEDFVKIMNHYGWKIVAVQDVDDKVGNGFTVVIQK